MSNTSPWLRRIVIVGLIWGGGILTASVIAEPTPENWTLCVSIFSSGLYTLALYATRQWWLPHLARRPIRNAFLLGTLNAAIIETLFLVVERLMGAEGVAAHPNLVMDLLITMPWYTGMVYIFVRVQDRQRFSPAIVLLLGGLYEVGGDGIAGQAFNFLGGDYQLLMPGYWILLGALAFWQFILVYSSMVLPPAWVIATTPPASPKTSIPAWRDALKPLLWLIPFIIYLFVVLVALSILSEFYHIG